MGKLLNLRFLIKLYFEFFISYILIIFHVLQFIPIISQSLPTELHVLLPSLKTKWKRVYTVSK